MRTTLVVFLITLIGLLWLNPTMDDFRRYVETRSEDVLLRETGDTALGRALSGAGGNLAGFYVDHATERHTYLVFSTYTIDLDGDDSEQDEWHFIGIAGRFYETQQPESLHDNER